MHLFGLYYTEYFFLRLTAILVLVQKYRPVCLSDAIWVLITYAIIYTCCYKKCLALRLFSICFDPLMTSDPVVLFSLSLVRNMSLRVILQFFFLQTVTNEYKSPLTSAIWTRWACWPINLRNNSDIYVCRFLNFCISVHGTAVWNLVKIIIS